MHPFIETLQAGLSECQAVGQKIVVAVSGGADSVALLNGCLRLREVLELQIVVAHLNHGLRGDAADDDAAWVENQCRVCKVPYVGDTRSVIDWRETSGASPEEAARSVRYEFLADAAGSVNAGFVAVAHTADDQAETVLHNILRGTGIDGLRGMQPTRQLAEGRLLIRPMLRIRRRDTHAFLESEHQSFRDDETNRSPDFTRNRIRNSVLPLLNAELNRDVSESLLRLRDQAADASTAIEECAAIVLRTALLDRNSETCRLLCDELTRWPRHLIRETFKLLWKWQEWPRKQYSSFHWDSMARVSLTGGAVTLPGRIDCRRRDGGLLVVRQTLATGDAHR